MTTFPLSVVTPDGLKYSGEVTSLLVHSEHGDLEFLAKHVDYVASIGTGRARITTPDGPRVASCSGGFVTMTHGEARLICVTFEFSDEIDLDRAKQAKEQAEERIRNASSEGDLTLAKAKLARALSRIKVAERF